MAVCSTCLEPIRGAHACGRQTEGLMRYFEYQHLPQKLQHVSRHFAVCADVALNLLPEGPEKTFCLRQLLLAKDAAVRAALDLPDV